MGFPYCQDGFTSFVRRQLNKRILSSARLLHRVCSVFFQVCPGQALRGPVEVGALAPQAKCAWP